MPSDHSSLRPPESWAVSTASTSPSGNIAPGRSPWPPPPPHRGCWKEKNVNPVSRGGFLRDGANYFSEYRRSSEGSRSRSLSASFPSLLCRVSMCSSHAARDMKCSSITQVSGSSAACTRCMKTQPSSCSVAARMDCSWASASAIRSSRGRMVTTRKSGPSLVSLMVSSWGVADPVILPDGRPGARAAARGRSARHPQPAAPRPLDDVLAERLRRGQQPAVRGPAQPDLPDRLHVGESAVGDRDGRRPGRLWAGGGDDGDAESRGHETPDGVYVVALEAHGRFEAGGSAELVGE